MMMTPVEKSGRRSWPPAVSNQPVTPPPETAIPARPGVPRFGLLAVVALLLAFLPFSPVLGQSPAVRPEMTAATPSTAPCRFTLAESVAMALKQSMVVQAAKEGEGGGGPEKGGLHGLSA